MLSQRREFNACSINSKTQEIVAETQGICRKRKTPGSKKSDSYILIVPKKHKQVVVFWIENQCPSTRRGQRSANKLDES